MILSPGLSEKAATLAKTDDSILPLFPPMERAVIIAVKEMMKNEKETGSATTRQHEHPDNDTRSSNVRDRSTC